MSIAWEGLSEFEQFSLLIHGFSGENRFMGLMSVAYCDESESQRVPQVYVVSGYLGTAINWFELGRRWEFALREEGLESTGFHMSKCEYGGDAPYNTMDRGTRDRLQQRFIDIINNARLWGYASFIELERYHEISQGIERKRRKGYSKPYYLAFQHTIEWMSNVLDDSGIAKSERIAFVFDQHQEYEGKAKHLYDSVKRSNNNLPYIHRLGSLTFDSDFCRPQLQAADIWAYESMRYIREVRVKGGSARWQFERLVRVGGKAHHNISGFGREQLDALARVEGWA